MLKYDKRQVITGKAKHGIVETHEGVEIFVYVVAWLYIKITECTLANKFIKKQYTVTDDPMMVSI